MLWMTIGRVPRLRDRIVSALDSWTDHQKRPSNHNVGPFALNVDRAGHLVLNPLQLP